MKYTGDLVTSSNNSYGSNNTDELVSGDFIINTKNSTLDTNHLIIGFSTAVTQNGLATGSAIDFTGAGISSSMILSAIQSSLENSNDGSGSSNGLLSGSSASRVINDGVNETKILLFTDGGSGSAEDVAVVLYSEGGTADQSFTNELTLTNLLKSTDISTLTHDNFWG